MSIKAIETTYKHYRFRSRTEARWAVFLDALDIQWEYEHEGFDLAGEWYLPDFWLPKLKLYLEVKGTGQDTQDDWRLCDKLCAASRCDVVMLFGEFSPLQCVGDDFRVVGSCRGWEFRPDQTVYFADGCWTFGECPGCHLVSTALHGQHRTCPCICGPVTTFRSVRRYAFGSRETIYCRFCGDSYLSAFDSPDWFHRHVCRKQTHSDRLLAAYAAARSARFEHGESPKVAP